MHVFINAPTLPSFRSYLSPGLFRDFSTMFGLACAKLCTVFQPDSGWFHRIWAGFDQTAGRFDQVWVLSAKFVHVDQI